MKTRSLLGFTFAQCAGFALGLISAAAAGSGVITFQEFGEASSDNMQRLIGLWRKTTIVFESPKDEHLVLHADGTAENWVATADSRSEPVTARWSVEGKTLTLSFGENRNSKPFAFYEGQLIFPNIPKRRGFWERLSRRNERDETYASARCVWQLPLLVRHTPTAIRT
jgi:hypothetical protein